MPVMPLQSGDRRIQLFKRLWPHFLIVTAAVGYLLLGGYLFFLIETRWALSSDEAKLPPQQQQLLKKSRELNGWLCANGDTINKIHEASKACRAWTESPNNLSVLTLLQEPWLQYHGRQTPEELAAECESALAKLMDCLHRRGNQNRPSYVTTIIGGRPSSPAVHEEWSWTTGVILAFTIVTTIGYGQVTPQTSAGRVFCIIYGIFGIPLVLLALANQGRFFSAWLLFSYKNAKRFFRWVRQRRRLYGSSKPGTGGEKSNKPNGVNGFTSDGAPVSDDSTSLASSEEHPEQTIPASVLLCIITGYLALGGYLIGQWESEAHWSFIDSTYFVFTSAASIGFGDLVPTNRARMALTFLYICLGLALTTTAIDIFAVYLRRLHYWGVKIKNVASTFVWFGGNKVTINQLVRTIGHELGASEDKIKTIVRHLDSVVNMAIQEAAEQNEMIVVEDLQFVENFIPAANERLLVHQNSFEFAMAEASLLSPLIFSPPDQQQTVVVDNNDNNKKRQSMTSMESVKSMIEQPEERRIVRMMRASAAGSEHIQFIDGNLAVDPQRLAARSVISVHSCTQTSTSPASPKELVSFADG